MAYAKKTKKDIYQIVTNQIIELLEQDIIPWKKPWQGGLLGMPKNVITKNSYKGVNVFLLASIAQAKGYQSPYWLTFKQAKSLGGSVRKGEKSSIIVFWKFIEKKTDRKNSKGETIKDVIPMLRYYNVFNIDQCQDIDKSKLPDDAYPEENKDELDFDTIDACEKIVDGMPNRPVIMHNEARAYYRPSTDEVNMPKQELFNAEEEYYSTLFHELIHSTGHASRLNRMEKESTKLRRLVQMNTAKKNWLPKWVRQCCAE